MKLSRRKSVIFTWMLSYILVFMIPMAAFLLCMMNFVDTLRQEVSYSNSVILKHVSSEMDNLISDVEKILDDVIFINGGNIVLTASVDDIREQQDKSVDALFREVFRC